MDIIQFANSKDVRAYWQKIGLKFTLPEACFLIWYCESITYEEKCKAWLEIIATMPDCSIEKRINCPHIESLHEFLSENIAADNKSAIDEMFEGLWFYFPMPFKKGDIVISKHGPFGNGGEPWVFVLTGFCFDSKERLKKYYIPHADCMDMTAYGYFQMPDGVPFAECMHKYTDLEYYRDELCGKQRILKPISALLKCEIDELLAMHAYQIICSEEKIKAKIKKLNYTKEGWKAAGIIK